MKRLFFTSLLLLVTTLIGHAQNFPQHKLGVSVSPFGKNVMGTSTPVDGFGSYNGKGYYGIGVNYLYAAKKWLDIESGLEYTHHRYESVSGPNPNVPKTVTKKKFSLLAIPVTARMNIWKYFFVNVGLLADFDLQSELNLTGIGMKTGVGLKYDFENGASLFLNPYFTSYGLLQFSKKNIKYITDETGLRLGVYFPLKQGLSSSQ